MAGRLVSERAGPLHGVRVLVTRPESAARQLAEAFAAEGAVAVCVPAVSIAPVEDTRPAERLRDRLSEVSVAVFTSVNAVDGLFGLMPDAAGDRLPAVVLAVGRATADALRSRGVPGVHVPSGRLDSEGLLACPQLGPRHVAGRLVALVKGEGGRDLLARELGRRGAAVIEATVYRRRAPERLARRLDRVRESVDMVTATSAESLENLLDAAPWTAAWLSSRIVIVASERVAGVARARNLPRVAVAGGADAVSMVEAAARAVAGEAPDRGVAGASDRSVPGGPDGPVAGEPSRGGADPAVAGGSEDGMTCTAASHAATARSGPGTRVC